MNTSVWLIKAKIDKANALKAFKLKLAYLRVFQRSRVLFLWIYSGNWMIITLLLLSYYYLLNYNHGIYDDANDHYWCMS